ncbi:MAG: hypothetical protein AMJ61_16735, partial [Desulfobacterales bacterium SG8_35_2]
MRCYNFKYRQTRQIFTVYCGNLNFQTKKLLAGEAQNIQLALEHFKSQSRVMINAEIHGFEITKAEPLPALPFC